MKKLLKSGICGSMNSTLCTVHDRKVNICGYCSMNITWTVTAFLQNAWKKKKRTKTQNTDVGSKRRRESKHTLYFILNIIQVSTLSLNKIIYSSLSVSLDSTSAFHLSAFCVFVLFFFFHAFWRNAVTVHVMFIEQ